MKISAPKYHNNYGLQEKEKKMNSSRLPALLPTLFPPVHFSEGIFFNILFHSFCVCAPLAIISLIFWRRLLLGCKELSPLFFWCTSFVDLDGQPELCRSSFPRGNRTGTSCWWSSPAQGAESGLVWPKFLVLLKCALSLWASLVRNLIWNSLSLLEC